MSIQFLVAFSLLLSIAAIQVFWILRLQKNYPHKFLAYLLYSIVVSSVYGLINFGGKQLISEIIKDNMEVIVVNQIVTTIGLPFLMAAFYFLLLFYTELRQGKCYKVFKIGYWITQLLAFAAYIAIVSQVLDLRESFQDYYLFYYLSNTQFVIIISIFLGNLFLVKFVKHSTKKKFVSAIIVADLLSFSITFILLEKIDLSIFFSNASFYTFISHIYFLTSFTPIIIIWYFLKKYPSLYDIQKSEVIIDENLYTAYNIKAREKEIIKLVTKGNTNDEIAETLFISPQTVKNTLSAIYKKVGVRNRIELRNLFS